MATIGVASASYYANASIQQFDRASVNSVERISKAKNEIANGDAATLAAMDYTFKLDLAGTQAALKNIAVTQAYLSTAITSIDSASAILAKIQELAVMGANSTNSDVEMAGINAEAEALADEFHKAIINANYKGKQIFTDDQIGANLLIGGGGQIGNYTIAVLDYDDFYDVKNPNTESLLDGVEYEVTRDLSDIEKEAIVARTDGVSVEDLTTGFRFTTNNVSLENVGIGVVKMRDDTNIGNTQNDNLASYTRNQAQPVRIDSGAYVSVEGEFNGGSIEFAINENWETSDVLSLADTDKISFRDDGEIIYHTIINGQNLDVEIGKLNTDFDGLNGKPLKIDLYSDATVPGTSTELLNGNFELPKLSEGLEPYETYTKGERRDKSIDSFSLLSVGSGYTQKIDTSSTGLARGSDTYSVTLVNKSGSGLGTGFRVNLRVNNDGSVNIVDILDKGQGYSVGDVLGLDDADELGGAGSGFQIRVDTVVNADSVGQGAVGVDRVYDPNFITVDVKQQQVGDGNYDWGEAYRDGDFTKVEALASDAGATLNYFRHENNGSYDFGDISNTSLIFNNKYDANTQTLTYNNQDVVLERVTVGQQSMGDTIVYEVNPDGTRVQERIEVGQQIASDKEVHATLQIAVGQQQAGDTAVYVRDDNGNIVQTRIEVGQQQAGDKAIAGAPLQIAVGQQQAGDTAVYVRDDNGNIVQTRIEVGQQQAGDKAIAGAPLQIAVGQQQAGDTAVYVRDDNGNIVQTRIEVGQQQAGDVAKHATIQVAVGQQQAGDVAIYLRDGNGNIVQERIEVGQQQAGDVAIAGPQIEIAVGNQQAGDTVVYSTHQAGGFYSWGEEYAAGDTVKIEGSGGGTSNYYHLAAGVYEWASRGQFSWANNGAVFSASYSKGDVVYEKSDVGGAGWNAIMRNAEVPEIAFYVREKTLNTTAQVSHYLRDTISHYERDKIAYFERNIISHYERNTVDYYERATISHYERDTVDYYSRPTISHYERDTVDYYSRPTISHYERDTIDYYERDIISHYERDKVAFYLSEKTLYTKEVPLGQAEKYLGETERNVYAHTGWAQNFESYIPNWTVYNDRVYFGQDFQIYDTDNGDAISSSTVDGTYTNNSVLVNIPTPTMQDMFVDPAYTYTDEWDYTKTATANVIGVDTPTLENGPTNNFVDYVQNETDGVAGNGMQLATGRIIFDRGNEFGVYHGPAIVSDVFSATAGQFLKMDYAALGTDDDYHVTGYIYNVDEVNPELHLAIGDTGTSANSRMSVEVPEKGNYRFVFIVGTYDKTGGRLAGADMTIDNIVAEDPYAIEEDAIAEILRAVQYAKTDGTTSSNPTKTLMTKITNGKSDENEVTLYEQTNINIVGYELTNEEDGPYAIVPTLNLVTKPSDAKIGSSDALISKLENVHGQLRSARIQAVASYGALDAALSSVTDLRSQYAMGSSTISDLNFTQEATNLTKRQIQMDIATSMLAQANKAQEGIMALLEK